MSRKCKNSREIKKERARNRAARAVRDAACRAPFVLEPLEGRVFLNGVVGGTTTAIVQPAGGLGINLNANDDFRTAALWLDVRKGFSPWMYTNTNNFLSSTDQTSTGYPLVNAYSQNFLDGYPDGIYTLQYNGTGTIAFSGKGQIVAGSTQTSMANGVTTTTAQVYVQADLADRLTMTATNVSTSDPITNMHLMMPGYSPGTTQLFNPAALRRLAQFSTIRLMDPLTTNASTIVNWSDRTTPADFAYTTSAGIAYEDAIALANTLHVNLWWNIPVQASTDFMTNLANMMKYGTDASGNPYTSTQAAPVYAPLDAGLKVNIEYANELWHDGFPADSYNITAAFNNSALPGKNLPNVDPAVSSQWNNEFVLAGEQEVFQLRQIHDAFSAVYGGSLSSNISFVFAGDISTSDFTQASFAYMSSMASTWGAPSTWISGFAVPAYVALSSTQDVAGLTLDQLFSDINNYLTSTFVPTTQADVAFAQSYGIPLYAYEGGQNLIPDGVNASLKLAAQTDPRMGAFYTALLNAWYTNGGGLFLPYSFVDGSNGFGAWGLLDNQLDTGSPKWDSVIQRLVPIGDDTLDGTVDYSDFLRLKAYWGATNATWEEGDFNGDDTVNAADFALLKANLNTASLTSAQLADVNNFPADGGTGLLGTYYSDQNLQTPVISRIDPTIDFNWDSVAPDPALSQSSFSAEWTGQIQAPTTETYAFRMFADDGVRVIINGQTIINDFTFGTHEDEGQINLVAGQQYSIEIDYFQGGSRANIDFQWETPTMPWTDVPASMLTPAAQPATSVSVTASTPTAVLNGGTATPGVFTLTRLGDPTAPLTVGYTLSGSAVNGTAYSTLSGSATFAAGVSSTTVTVTPLADPSAIAPETVTLTLSTPASGYTLGSSTSATVGISQINGLPAGWQENDIGFPSPAGSASFDGTTWSVVGGGSDIYNSFDQFSLVDTTLTGDSTLIGTVNSQANTDTNAKSGLMFRDSTAAGAAFVGLFASPGAGINLEYRTTDGGTAMVSSVLPATTLPITLELDRQGNSFTAFYSLNGIAWTAVPTPITVAMPSAALAGLAVTSHNSGTANLSTFTNVSVASGADVVSVAPTTPSAALIPTLTTGTYTFTRTGLLASALTANFTLSGTAVEGTDYSLSSSDSAITAGTTGGTVTFAAGSPTATITLTPLAGGQSAASTAVLAVSSSAAYTLGVTASATVNIASRPSVTVVPTDASATESAAPADTGLWTFTRSGPTTAALTVNFTLSGTAVEGTDYSLSSTDSPMTATTTSGTITFATGASTATLLLTPINSAATASVTASLTLATGSYAVGTATATSITILPPVVAASVTLAATDSAATFGAISADNGLWTFTRTGSTTLALAVNFTLSGTALEGTDYSLASADSTLTATTTTGTITFAAGAGTATIALTPLASGSGKTATLALATGSYTIATVAGQSISIAAAAASGSLNDADIGSPALAGSASFSSTTGVWTQSGGGGDIWGGSDQFNFDSTSITGDTTLLAEVTSLTSTDPWAKAGLMLRAGSGANAANVAVVATPGNGVSFQWRASAGAGSNFTNIGTVPIPSAAAPVWLKLTRIGNLFTASYSTNGVNYTVVGSQTIALSSSLLAGLVVTAHNNTLLATAKFANVAVPYTGTVVTSVPAMPTLTALSGVGTASLSWASVAGATSYDLYRSTTSGGEGTTPYLTNLGGTAYSDTAVTAGTKYYYTLTSVDSAGQSTQSGEASATPTASASTGTLSDADIGAPGKGGSGVFNSSTGIWTIAGGGSDIWNNSDQFNFASTAVAGDTTLVAEVTSLSGSDPWTKAGLMFRDGLAANAANVAVVATPGNGVSFQWRASAGAGSSYVNVSGIPVPTAAAPIWLKLARVGNVFTASYSTNGTAYTVIGSQTIAISSSLLAGLAVTAHNNNLLATATFANVAIPASGGTVTAPGIPTLAAAGAAGAVNLSWATVSGATSYDLYRSTTAGGEGTTPYLTNLTGTGYSDTSVTAGITYYYTLTAVTSGLQSAQSTEVSAAPTVAAATGALTDADIGSPGKAGSGSLAGGIWALTGGGSDIWNNSDQFNFASTTVAGDSTLVAEVTSLTSTDVWAKAGLMYRDGSGANAANVALVATPGNGVSFQWRATAGGSSNYTNIGGIPVPSAAAPVWLKLMRAGNVFTASYSTNGTNYAVVGTQTIVLSNSLLGGLAVTAHNNGLLATATFANVAIPLGGTTSTTATGSGGSGGGLSDADTDIGSPGKAGSASFDSANSVWTVAGGGSDIWLNDDHFNFSSTAVAGDATLTTEVTSLSGTDSWTKAGLMFRQDLSSTAANASLFITPGNGVSFQWRLFNGDSSANVNIPGIPAPSPSAPVWLKLNRTGNVFTASYSTNGTTYTTIGTETITLSSSVLAGLAVTAHNNNLLATATFSNTSV